jgi:RHS repeat-associated protein
MRERASLSRIVGLAVITLSITVLLPLVASPQRALPPQGPIVQSSGVPVPARAGSATPPSGNTASSQTRIATYGNLPLRFEENVGQTDSKVQFISRGSGYTLFLTPGEAVFKLSRRNPTPRSKKPDSAGFRNRLQSKPTETSVIRMKVDGATGTPTVTGMEKLPGVTNYLIGNDPSKWHKGITSYSKVQYSEVYSGVDLVYYGNQHQLEYDFVVKPGSDPKQLSMGFEGTQGMSVTASGDISIQTKTGNLTFRKPKIYQVQGGQQVSVDGRFKMNGNGHVGFEVSPYDRTKPLVIDPVLAYSTYLGGSAEDSADGVAVDSSGNAYVTGTASSSNFPIVGTSISSAPSGGNDDAFVSKLNSTGTALVYSTYLGGTTPNTFGDLITDAYQVAVDASGRAYLTGETTATDFPATSNAYQTSLGSGAFSNAFVTKLSADGQSLLYSTFLGAYVDYGEAIAVDANQNAYIAGQTLDLENFFPTTSNAVQRTINGSGAAFLSRIDTTLSGASSLIYSTYLGGSTSASGMLDVAYGVAVDANQNAYLTGWACTLGFPTTSTAFQTTGSPTDCSAFLSEINTAASSGSSLVYSTYLGGTLNGDFDDGWAVTLDSAGKVYISGCASSPDFPTTTGALTDSPGRAFVAKFDTSQSGSNSLLLSTVFGGSSGDSAGGGVKVDSTGNIYLAGWSYSTDFPTTSDAVQTTATLSDNASISFFTVLSSNMLNIVYSTYLGGTPAAGYYDGTYGMTLDQNNNAYLAGQSTASNLETTSGALQTTLDGISNGYVTKLTDILASAAPSILSANSATFVVNSSGLFNVTTTGSPAPTTSESGSLPSGVTFNATTGILTGTPAAGTAGAYSITFTASNGVGSNATQSFTVIVDQPPAISSGNSTTFMLGSAGSFTVTGTGFPTPTFGEFGLLPSGVTFNGVTGALGGTPAAGTAGSYPITFTAINGVGSNATQYFTLTVDQSPAITSANSATFTVSAAGSFTATATGTPAPTFSVSGILPSGVTLSSGGVLSGTPASGTTGSYSITLTASNGVGSNATQSFTLTVQSQQGQAPQFTSTNGTTLAIGTAASFTVTATGAPTPTLSESGALPSGVSFNSGTGLLSGTPASGTNGSYPITFTASNGVGSNATQSFTLLVDSAGGNVFYYFGDTLGSARVMTTSTGAICFAADFYPFGGEQDYTDNCTQNYKFTGKERDGTTSSETGLDYFGARHYSSQFGRFMTPDPSGIWLGNLSDPQQLNLYSYVRNNPLNLTDPTGLDCVYLNDSGDGVESVDHNSSQQECWDPKSGGYWANGYVADSNSSIVTNPNNDTIGIYSSDGYSIANQTTTWNPGSMGVAFTPWLSAGDGSGGQAQTPTAQTPTIGPNHNYEGSKKQLCDNKSNKAMLADVLPFGSTLLGGDYSPGEVGTSVAKEAFDYGRDAAIASPMALKAWRSLTGMPMTMTSKVLSGLGLAATAYSAYHAAETGKNTYQACIGD